MRSPLTESIVSAMLTTPSSLRWILSLRTLSLVSSHVIRDSCLVGIEREDVAVCKDADVILVHAEVHCHFLMQTEHSVFTVDGNKELRLDQGVEHHELVPVSVA